MKKAFVVEKVGNGLLITITNEEGREEQYVVPKDDSLSFAMFVDAFDASATSMNSANVEDDGGDVSEEPQNEGRNRKPTTDDYEDLERRLTFCLLHLTTSTKAVKANEGVVGVCDWRSRHFGSYIFALGFCVFKKRLKQ